MNKIFLIIKREYITRVRKRSFIVMSIIGPLLFAAMIVLPAWLMTRPNEEVKRIVVVDSTMQFVNKLPETQYLKFDYNPGISVENLKKVLKNNTRYDAILYIPKSVETTQLENGENTNNDVQLIFLKQPNFSISENIASAIEKELQDKKLQAFNIDNLDKIMESVKTKVNIQSIKLTNEGEKKSNATVMMAIGYVTGLLIYMFIFIFGAQVMRSVIEEKTNRIVEIIISSVKPFQLMMGKVIGVALVVLTQISVWIVMTLTLVVLAKAVMLPNVDMAQLNSSPQSVMATGGSMGSVQAPSADKMEQIRNIQNVFSYIQTIPFTKIILCFVFFFIGGYLLYGSFFAAIGSAVDVETDTQQFMMPITIPLILGLFVMFYALNNYDSPLAYWFSMIPLTSPIVMMARIPFDIPTHEILLSAGILVITFIGAIWMAGKIYHTGILMYGKKVTYKDMFKWLKYKN